MPFESVALAACSRLGSRPQPILASHGSNRMLQPMTEPAILRTTPFLTLCCARSTSSRRRWPRPSSTMFPAGPSTAETFQPVVDALGRRERLVIAASGSSRHAGLAGEIMLEDLAGIPVDVEYASEYTYRSTHTLHNPGVLVISQSGETADTLAALREAQARGLATVAITNNARLQHGNRGERFAPNLCRHREGHPGDKKLHHATGGALLRSLCTWRASAAA